MRPHTSIRAQPQTFELLFSVCARISECYPEAAFARHVLIAEFDFLILVEHLILDVIDAFS
jgi:hypothetical protein